MDRRPGFRGFALCLALLASSCATQRSDGTLGETDAGATAERGLPDADDVGSAPTKDAGSLGGDDLGAGTADDAGSVDEAVAPADVGGGGESDVPTPTVDAGEAPADAGAPDTGPVCTGSQVACAGACVDTRTSAAHCGGCGRTCATGQSCVAGACALVCTGSSMVCGGACVDVQTSAAHCGMCDRPCAAGATCMAGRCVGGMIPGASFQVALTPTACVAVDHTAVTGGDRGGLVASGDKVFYSGDTSTGRFDLADLAHGEAVGRVYDALVSDLATGTIYTLVAGSTPLTQAGGTVTTLLALDGATGGLTGTFVNLSQPIPLPASGGVGIFSGYERIILMGGGRAWHVSLPGGAVIDLGAVPLPMARVACDSWAIWGTAEFFGGSLYVDYVQSATAIARMRLPDGNVAPLATFTSLGDMCSFTVSPRWRRWYFHHETASQFRSAAGQTVGYCNATITGPTLPCRPIDVMCSGACTDLQTSAAHCGGCGMACAAGQVCTAGACVTACPAGQTACTGRCVDMTTDSANCGACGRTCVGSQWCINGACGGGSRYAVTRPTTTEVPYLDACGATGSQRFVTSSDDSGASTTLPFATRWWGAALASGAPMYVVSNGNVQVNVMSGSNAYSGTIPSVVTPNSMMAPQWRDLATGTSGVCVATLGTAPNRRWVAQWAGARNLADFESSLNFEVILHEASGIVDFAYGAMSIPALATIGLENAGGTAAFSGCTGSTYSCTSVSNSRIRFTPVE